MTKKLKTFIFLIVITITNLLSQNTKHSISISIGGSLPLGDYVSKDFNNPNSGYAKMGFDINLNYSYKIYNYISGTVMIGIQSNPKDVTTYQNDVNKGFISNGSNARMENLSTNGITKFSILAGPKVSIPLINKVFIEPKVLAGFSSIYRAEVNSNINIGTWSKSEGKSAICFAYQFGLGLKYKLNNKVFLLANIDYNNARVEIKDILFIDGFNGSNRYSYSQTVTTLNPSFGFGYSF